MSVIYEVSIPLKTEMPVRVVGLDVGVKTLVTLSDGSFIENNRYLSKYEKRIARIQIELSRKVKRSNNYYKCKHKLAVLYSKLANARKYYLHCGHRDESYRDLRKRVYECRECKNTMDRDLNASINIAFEGLTKYMKEVYA